MFFDDREHDLLVRVVSLDNIPALNITSPLVLLITLPSKHPKDHLSESLIPLSSLPRSPKDEESTKSTPNGNQPSILSAKPRILSSRSPNGPGVLIDPPEISVYDVPPRPHDRPSGDLRSQITDGQCRREHEGDKAQYDKTSVQGRGEEG